MKFRPTKAAVAASIGIGGLVIGLAAPAVATQASHAISGSLIKKHSVSGSRLKNNTLTGKQIKESTLGTVPKATTAIKATTATTATVAGEALTTPALTWTNFTLENGWTVPSGSVAPAYAVDSSGLVYFRGQLAGGGTGDGQPPFALPAAITPAHTFSVPVHVDFTTQGYTGSLKIGSTGKVALFDDISLSGSAALGVTIDGVSYSPTS